MDFKDLAIVLKAAEGDKPAVVLGYGEFLQTVFDFAIIALAIFVAIKAMNALKKQELPPAPPEPPPEERLLTEIRDILKSAQ